MNLRYLLFLFFIVSCEPQESKNSYQAPPSIEKIETKNLLDNLNQDGLNKIRYVLTNHFNLKHIDLNKGFSFFIDISEIGNYIDCGFMNDEIYVDYIERIFGSSLKATVRLDLVEDDNLFNIEDMSINYLFQSKETGTRWKFKTNKPRELLVGNPVYDDNPYRICMSVNALEKEIIELIRMENV